MPPLRVLRTYLVLAAVGAALFSTSARAQSDEPLKVIRVSPSGEARPTATITVTFDRPVAGSLDRTIDPKTILSVQPPGGIDPRYATISLRSSGDGNVRWSVDGIAHSGSRWALVRGKHVIRAVAESGEQATAGIVVEEPNE